MLRGAEGHPRARARDRPTRYLIGGPIDLCVKLTFKASSIGICEWDLRGERALPSTKPNYIRNIVESRVFCPVFILGSMKNRSARRGLSVISRLLIIMTVKNELP